MGWRGQSVTEEDGLGLGLDKDFSLLSVMRIYRLMSEFRTFINEWFLSITCHHLHEAEKKKQIS